MLFIPPPPYRRRPQKTKAKAQPAPAANPVLVSASFHTGTQQATLTFDRPVQVAAFNVNSITLSDPNDNVLYTATSASVVDGTIVILELKSFGEPSTDDAVLNATGDSGIAAVGGGAWAGVTDFPYGG